MSLLTLLFDVMLSMISCRLRGVESSFSQPKLATLEKGLKELQMSFRAHRDDPMGHAAT